MTSNVYYIDINHNLGVMDDLFLRYVTNLQTLFTKNLNMVCLHSLSYVTYSFSFFKICVTVKLGQI